MPVPLYCVKMQTSHVFIQGNIYKSYFNAPIELRPNPGLI